MSVFFPHHSLILTKMHSIIVTIWLRQDWIRYQACWQLVQKLSMVVIWYLIITCSYSLVHWSRLALVLLIMMHLKTPQRLSCQRLLVQVVLRWLLAIMPLRVTYWGRIWLILVMLILGLFQMFHLFIFLKVHWIPIRQKMDGGHILISWKSLLLQLSILLCLQLLNLR